MGGFDGFDDTVDLRLESWPLLKGDDDDGYVPTDEVLLILHVPILKLIPALLGCRADCVFKEVLADWDGRSLVQEYAHLEMEQIWGWLCLSRELQYSLDLFAVEAVVPLQEVVDGCSGLGVLEDGGDGHAGVAEDPCAA